MLVLLKNVLVSILHLFKFHHSPHELEDAANVYMHKLPRHILSFLRISGTFRKKVENS